MFFVLLTGEGEGCDYTIACNKDFMELKAATWEEAEKEVAKICEDYEEPDIDGAKILEVITAKNFDVAAWRQAKRKAARLEKEQREKDERKAAYEKLKAEFEPDAGQAGPSAQGGEE